MIVGDSGPINSTESTSQLTLEIEKNLAQKIDALPPIRISYELRIRKQAPSFWCLCLLLPDHDLLARPTLLMNPAVPSGAHFSSS